MKNTNQSYDEEYIEQIFYIWYESGRATGAALQKVLPAAPNGAKPNRNILADWMRSYGWIERADVLDVQRSNLLDKRAIARRADMLERQAKIGKALLDKGYNYIQEHEPTSVAEAVRLVVEGKTMERESLGYSEILQKYGQMQNTELDSELRKLLGAGDEEIEGEIVDVTEVADDTPEA